MAVIPYEEYSPCSFIALTSGEFHRALYTAPSMFEDLKKIRNLYFLS